MRRIPLAVFCAACRPKPTTANPHPKADHRSCRYAYGCECWCIDGRPHQFPKEPS